MSNVFPGVLHSSAGWPTIEKSFNEDPMGRRFDLSTKGVKSIYGSGNCMTNWNAKSKTIKSGPDLVDKLPPPFAVGSLADKSHDVLLQSLLLKGGFSKPILRMLTRVGKLVMHTTFAKSEVDSKCHASESTMETESHFAISFFSYIFLFTDCLLDSVFDSSAGNCAVLYSKGDYAPVGLRIQRTVL